MAETSQLAQLSNFTEIVADTGEIEQIKNFQPQDATTNPSLLYKAAQIADYKHLIDRAIESGKGNMDDVMDNLAVNFGVEILKHVKGVVSTELDARLSFDTDAMIDKARRLHKLYEAAGIDPKKQVLIKIATTWEGIQAMKVLEKEGIRCNMTLLFSLWQAAAAAEGGAFLISPFVGRITDWHKAKNGWTELPEVEEDPGVLSVRQIYGYYKTFGLNTVVMGASFRSKGQVLGLAGCDKLTVSPKLLKQMQDTQAPVPRILGPETAKFEGEKLVISEKNFRWGMNEDPVGTEKLADGIRRFAQDTVKLEGVLTKLMSA